MENINQPSQAPFEALSAAVRAAEAVAIRTASTPAEAAMQVACAFLIARAQLELAVRAERRTLSDIASAAVVAVTGYAGPSPEDSRAMSILGLQPLFRMKTVPPSP
jgi:predicted naringenin-chalcone synthase